MDNEIINGTQFNYPPHIAWLSIAVVLLNTLFVCRTLTEYYFPNNYCLTGAPKRQLIWAFFSVSTSNLHCFQNWNSSATWLCLRFQVQRVYKLITLCAIQPLKILTIKRISETQRSPVSYCLLVDIFIESIKMGEFRNQKEADKPLEMFTLEKTRNYLTVIGVRPVPEQNFPSFLRNSRKAFNSVHILFLFLSFVTYNISIFCFLMFEATSFTQFSEAGLFYLVGYLHLSFYTVSIWKRSKILSFIDDIEEIIRQSKINHWKLLPSSEIVSFNWLVCP